MEISTRRGPVVLSLDPQKRRLQAECRAEAFCWGKLTVRVALAILAMAAWLAPDLAGQRLFWVPLTTSISAGVMLLLCGIGDRRVSAGKRPAPWAVRRTSPPQTKPVPRLGQILVHQMRLITQEQLQQALTERRRSGCPLGQAVVEMGCITPRQLEQALARQRLCEDHHVRAFAAGRMP